MLFHIDREGDGSIKDVGTKEDFETQEMKERVRAYHESLNSNMDAASEYMNEGDDIEFTTDDVAMPVGYQVVEGDYLGLPGVPDIDEMINAEDAKTESDSYDKYVGVDVILPNSTDQKLMAKVKKKVKSDDRNDPSFYNPLRDHSL